jgi:hypothetical protein
VLIVEKVNPPRTATGTLLDVVEPSPSSPSVLPPQQYAAPPVVSPQVWIGPVATAENVSPPLTATGTVLDVVEPLPSRPVSFVPQQ